MRTRYLLLPLFILTALSLRAQSTESFTAGFFCELTGMNEVPAVNDGVRGLAILRLDSSTNTLHYRLTVEGIIGATGARLLSSNAYEADRVIANLPGLNGSGGTATGSVQLTVEHADTLGMSGLSIEVTSNSNPQGHIRGTIIPVPNALAPEVTARQEVGHAVTDSSGSGSAILFVDERLMVATYLVSWQNLTGPATMAHFHQAPIGVSGPVVQPLIVTAGQNAIIGVWLLNDSLLAALKRAEIYVNIHTADNPDGEIRGQIFPTDFYTAALDPANEVPDHSDSSNAGGTAFAAIFRHPQVGGVLAVRARATDAATGWTMGHVHAGPRGVNGPVMQPLLNTPVDGWIVPPIFPRIVSADTIAEFRAGRMYINLHTERFPGGEVRGQLVPASSNVIVSGVPGDRTSPVAITMTAAADRGGSAVRVSISGEGLERLRNPGVELVDPLGRTVARGALDGGSGRIDCPTAAAGTYRVVLVESGITISSAPVVIIR